MSSIAMRTLLFKNATLIYNRNSKKFLIDNKKLNNLRIYTSTANFFNLIKINQNFLNYKLFEKNYSNSTTSNNNNNKSQIDNDGASSNLNGIKIESAFLARQFINTLSVNERLIIKEELIKAEQESQTLLNDPKIVANPSWKQILIVCFQNGLPFIGFGFVDNFLMIVAGDLIESSIGFYFPISTMAAAGLGNAISDVAGIGLAHHIDYFCSKLIGVPRLSPEQLNLSIVNWAVVISKSLCIFIGCIIGMFPLLFIKHESEHEENNKKSDANEKK